MALQQRDDRVFNSWRKVLHSGRRQKVNVPGPIAWASLVRHGPNFKPVCEPAIFSPSGIGTVSGDGSAGHSPPGRYTFVDFPGEIRNLIYRLSLHYPDSFDLYYAYNQRIDEFYRRKMRGSNERFPRYEQVMRTPTILLLCKAITREALPILHASTLVIDRIPPWPPMAPHPLMVSQFIGRRTLQNIKKLEIRVSFGDGRFGSGWAWNKILVDLLSVLIERNSFTDMKIMIKLCDLENTDLWESEFSEYMALMRTIESFRLRNPNIFSPGTITIERWVLDYIYAWRFDDELGNTPKGCKGQRHTEVRVYPDPDIWQGSILEFL